MRNTTIRSTRSMARLLRRVAWPCLLAAMLCAPVLAGKPSAQDDNTLRATLETHLQAINARDLDTLMSTVTEGAKLTTILPNGAVLTTREQYRELHVAWFEDTGWRMVFDIEDVERMGDMGIARVRYDSQARDEGGEYASKRIAQLTLVFQRQQDGWRLVYDQNTVVPPSAD
jgi:uncharacterized protein (TIGR02246 family)